MEHSASIAEDAVHCLLLTAHHRHHSDTRALYSLVTRQVQLGPSLTIMPTSSSPSHWSRLPKVTANVSPMK